MSKLPFIQWYTGDWLKDPAVSMCTPSTRGIWFDMLCAMHEIGRSGSLRGTPEQIARIARCSTTELAQALTEIQITEVADVHTDRHGVVTVTNRRMLRDARQRENAAKRQQKRRARDGTEDDVTPDVTHESRPGHGDISYVRRQTSDFISHISERHTSDVKRPQEAIQPKRSANDVDALKGLAQEDVGLAVSRFRRTARVVRPSGKDPQRAKDLDLLAKAAILSVTRFSENWLADATEAVRIQKSNKPPCAYFHGVLRSKSELLGADLNRELAMVVVPDGFIQQSLDEAVA